MPVLNPHQTSPLRRTTSRTRTARTPIAGVKPIMLFCTQPCFQLYAGPVDSIRFPAASPIVPALHVRYGLDDALQTFVALQDPTHDGARAGTLDPYVVLILDLGKNYDVGRIELYGNFALPPFDENGRPLFNFGVPRSIGVAVAETPAFVRDLHERAQVHAWTDAAGSPFHTRYEARDVRALYGWTPISPEPAYGRFVLVLFADLPLVSYQGRQIQRGIDIQRLLVFPFLEDSDHVPEIEYAPVSSRQTSFSGGSFYWTMMLEPALAEPTHQSIFLTPDGRLHLPSALCGKPGAIDTTRTRLYSSDLVALDGADTVALTLAATTDEIPLVSGVRLFHPFTEPKVPIEAPPGVVPTDRVSYDVRVLVTNDPEAAWSTDDAHPSWNVAVASHVTRLSASKMAQIMFDEPHWARYVRLRVRVLRLPDTAPEATHGRFFLARLTLIRSRDFWIRPEPGQDVRVDLVLMRLYGAKLTDDYAFIDGEGGMALTLEARQGAGAFQTLKSVRTLLDLVENTQVRPVANARISDRRVQRIVEHVTGEQSGTQDSSSTTITDNTVTLIPDRVNFTVTRAGTYTMHGNEATTMLMQLGGFPNQAFNPPVANRLLTERFFTDGPAIPNPFDTDDLFQKMQTFSQYVADAEQSGRPVSVGIGINGSIGGAAGITGSVGGSFTISTQTGGGKTISRVSGDQASGAFTQTETVRQETNQRLEAIANSRLSRTGTSDETRVVDRTDESAEQRGRSLAVRYGGQYEDILLVTWPVQRMLSAANAGDAIRLRVDHLPPGVRIDVEFRGSVLARVKTEG